MKQRLPNFASDDDVEGFLEGDISEYLNPEELSPVSFEFEPKTKVVNLRMPEGLYRAVTDAARRRGVPYQRYIRQVLERFVREELGQVSL